TIPGNFTFVIMTDREDLDDQIWRTFIGCGVTDEKTPRAASGKDLQEILRGNHRFVFSLNLKGDERTYAHSYPTESRCIVGPMINRERPCLNDMRNGRGVPMKTFDIAVSSVTGFLERVTQLNARYRSGEMHVYVPEALHDSEHTLDE